MYPTTNPELDPRVSQGYPDFDGKKMEGAITAGRQVKHDNHRQEELAEGLRREGLAGDQDNLSAISAGVKELEELLPVPEGTTPTTEKIGQVAVNGTDQNKTEQ